MRALCAAFLLLVLTAAALPQPVPPTLIKTPGAKPAEFIGFPLAPTSGVRVDADGREHPIAAKARDAQAFEDTGGEQSVGLSPTSSLRWRLDQAPGEAFYLYFLCRTGHQSGYEYVYPDMTYVLDVNGEPVRMEAVTEVAAVRTYQSEGSWGHDMSWIRSADMKGLAPGDVITIGCNEKYAFVTRCLLVSEQAHAITGLIGRATAARASLLDAETLLTRIAEVFADEPVREACDTARQTLEGLHSDMADLQERIKLEAEEVAAGAKPNVAPLMALATTLATDCERAEVRIDRRVRAPLKDLLPGMRDQLRGLASPATTTSYHARQADLAAETATIYLDAARAGFDAPAGISALRRSATYTWRAQEFIAKAQEEAGRGGAGMTPRPITPARPEHIDRDEIILNGVWEMTTGGSPDAPPETGWFPIRVPHGPWGETVGSFMALDRKWPGGQHWAWYRTRFDAPDTWTAGHLKLHFEAVFHLCEVYVNGAFCGRHIGGFDSFDVDATSAIRPGQTNEILCFVHDTSVTALPKSDREGEARGHSAGPNHYITSDLWGRRFGGIWQDVSLMNVPAVRVEDVFLITSVRDMRLTVKTWLRNETDQALQVALMQDVSGGDGPALALPEQEVTLQPGSTQLVEASLPWPSARLWGIGGEWGDPRNLYRLSSHLSLRPTSARLDTHSQRFGFREFRIEDGRFLLNGKRLPLQGGGGWYLQESKIAHGNRWFGLHMYRSDRGMNVNMHRWHRHGDTAREFFDLGDELGMLAEPEGPNWGVFGIPDIMGIADWDDPVWVRNVTEHFRRWTRKHRNHPSVVLWSIENETFCSTRRPKAMVDRYVAFGNAVNEEDPTRPVTFHGVENGRYCTKRDDIEIVNLHYPSNERVTDWREKWGGRPCINGEFQNYPVLFAMSGPDREQAAGAVDDMCEYIESWTSYYDDIQLAGALCFLPYMCGLFTTADPGLMGPWADLLPDSTTAPVSESGWRKGSVSVSAWVPIAWPSLSGPGIKCEQLRAGSGHLSMINWFDPSRPSITPNRAYQAFADHWRKMPRLPSRRAPEVIVRVLRAGEPVAGVPVRARATNPHRPSPRGAVTDPEGTAWILFDDAGSYELSCGEVRVEHDARWLDTYAKPGYEDIPRVTLELP